MSTVFVYFAVIFLVSFIFCIGYITCALLSANSSVDNMLLSRYVNKARTRKNHREIIDLIESAEEKLLESYEEEYNEWSV